MANNPKTVEPDDTDVEVGERLVFRYKGDEFTIENIAKGRKWRETVDVMARLSGEDGLRAMTAALTEVLGAKQLAKTDDYEFAQFQEFATLLGERLAVAFGTAGESRGSRR